MIFLAVLLLGGAEVDRQAPPATSMIVTQEQFVAALGTCRSQLAKPDFVESEIVAAGWPKVASQASDGHAPAMSMYRHPENMLLLTLFNSPEPKKPDQCIVMVPLGPQLDMQGVRAGITSFAGKRADGTGTTWNTEAVDIRLEQMQSVGARAILTQKEPK